MPTTPLQPPQIFRHSYGPDYYIFLLYLCHDRIDQGVLIRPVMQRYTTIVHYFHMEKVTC